MIIINWVHTKMNSNIGVATQPTIAPITQVKPAVNKLSGRFEISIIS